METYKNLGGDSGVKSYDIRGDFIIVQFISDGSKYKYSYRKPGRVKVEKMKNLAKIGQGLNEYINIYIKKNYESRSR